VVPSPNDHEYETIAGAGSTTAASTRKRTVSGAGPLDADTLIAGAGAAAAEAGRSARRKSSRAARRIARTVNRPSADLGWPVNHRGQQQV
jgi:hypothetical protein